MAKWEAKVGIYIESNKTRQEVWKEVEKIAGEIEGWVISLHQEV